MKVRSIVVSLFVVLVLAGTVAFFLTRPLSKSMEELFPVDALMYARLSNVGSNIDQFTQTIFWKHVSTINLPKVLEYNKVPQQELEQLRKIQKEIVSFFENPLTRKFFGKEVAVGFYGKDSSKSRVSLSSEGFLFATRLGGTFQMAELLASMALQWSDDITTTSKNYDGFNIVRVHFNKRNFDMQYVRIRDVLFVSILPSEQLHRILDVYRKKSPSLALDSSFSKNFLQAYPDGHGIFYVNTRGVYDILNKYIPKEKNKEFKTISEEFLGFRSYAVSLLPGRILKMKMILGFESSELGSYWRSMLSCSGVANTSLKFVPHNVMFYQWGGCYDFQDMWTRTREGLQFADQFKEQVQQWKFRLEKRFKINIYEDVLPMIGTQVGGFLNDVDTQGLFPYPRGVFFIKIENQQAAIELMDKLIQNPLGMLKKENYLQSSIQYFTLPLGANMDPGYTFLGDYLLLGSSKQLLKASIDAFNNSNQSLQSKEVLKQFDINSSDLNRGMVFIKVDDMSKRLQQLLDWRNKTVSSQITAALSYQQGADQRRKELEEYFVSKKEDLRLAQKKLTELQANENKLQISEEERSEQQENLRHLVSEIKLLKEDIGSFGQQQKELEKMTLMYKNQSEFAKAWLFNSDELFMPLLKGIEGIHELGIKLRLNGQVNEAEMFIQ